MAINFITGLPRQGKTLYALWHVKHRADKEKRQVYTCNLTGVTIPGWLQIDHPDKWMEIPDNSILIVDELQDFWPKNSSGQKVPTPIVELSKHGKRGIDFYFITQEPNLVHTTPRDLCEWHYYVVRAFGTESAMVYKMKRMQLHPDKSAKGSDCEKIPFKYPKEVYGWYKSADVHNVKRNIPWRIYAMPIALVVAIGLGWFGVRAAQGTMDRLKSTAQSDGKKLPDGITSATVGHPGQAVTGRVQPQSDADVLASYEPRIRGLPQTAPRYDQLTEPTEVPYPAACVSMGTRCSCYTQQGTHLDTPIELCLQIVKKGYFVDWQRQQQQEKRSTPDRSREVPDEKPQQSAQAPYPVNVPAYRPQQYARIPTAGSTPY